MGAGKTRYKLTLEHSELEISARDLDMVEAFTMQLKVVIHIHLAVRFLKAIDALLFIKTKGAGPLGGTVSEVPDSWFSLRW